jgi:hypothetical protein
VVGAEILPRRVAVVRPAAQGDLGLPVPVGSRERHAVVEFERIARVAAPAVGRNEGAALVVAGGDCTADRGGDVASRRACRDPRLARAVVSANFARRASRSSASSARSKMRPRSPSGIWWRSSACASRSLACVSGPAVNWTL